MKTMQWKTAIGTVRNDTAIVRGRALIERAVNDTFVENVYVILTGKMPNKEIARLLNVALSLSLDHGLGTVSTLTARCAASANVSLQQALIAGIASMGHAHGGATEDAALWFSREVAESKTAHDAVFDMLTKKQRIPGFGHTILAGDERATVLMDEAKKLGYYGTYAAFAEAVQAELTQQKTKSVPLNIDGALAAMLLDIGLPPRSGTGLFILGRLPGLLAHILEEEAGGQGLRRLDEEEIIFESP